MKIASWNVNGIRAISKKGYLDWFKKESADFVCLQETKAFPDQLNSALQCPAEYNCHWHAGTRPGYAGTATFTKNPVAKFNNTFPPKYFCFQDDGRIIETIFGNIHLFNIYFPNGGTIKNGQNGVEYKLQFYELWLEYINNLVKKKKSIITCGDFNICHQEIDIARPKENANSIGFLPIERAMLDKIFQQGYIDVFRYFYPTKKDQYTWWSYRTKARNRNIGWRLDYFIVSPDLKDRLISINHQTEILGSDHCPIILEITN